MLVDAVSRRSLPLRLRQRVLNVLAKSAPLEFEGADLPEQIDAAAVENLRQLEPLALPADRVVATKLARQGNGGALLKCGSWRFPVGKPMFGPGDCALDFFLVQLYRGFPPEALKSVAAGLQLPQGLEIGPPRLSSLLGVLKPWRVCRDGHARQGTAISGRRHFFHQIDRLFDGRRHASRSCAGGASNSSASRICSARVIGRRARFAVSAA